MPPEALPLPANEAAALAVPIPSAQSADAPSLPTTRHSEARKAKEVVSADREINEITQLGSVVLQQKGRELDEMSADKYQEALAQDHCSEDILSLYRLNHLPPCGKDQAPGRISKNPPESGSRPVYVSINGEQKIVYVINSFDGTNFSCMVPGESPGSEIQATIPKSAIFRGQILAVKDSLLNSSSFTLQEKALLDMYLKLVDKGKDGIDNLGTEAVDKVIAEAAKELGVPTANNLEAFINHVYSETGGKSLTQQQREQKEKALSVLEDKNIADPGVVVDVLRAAGYTPESISQSLTEATKSLKQAEENYRRNPNQQTSKELEMVKMHVDFLKRANLATVDKRMENYFKDVYEGKVTKENGQKMARAFQEGKFDELVNLIAPDLPKDGKFKEYMSGAGFFLALLLFLTDKLTESVGGTGSQ